MERFQIDQLQIRTKTHPIRERVWREWCFFLAVLRHRGFSFLLLTLLLLVGGVLFYVLEPEKEHTFPQAIYYTFSLIFGEPPEEFPKSVVLQALFFIVPMLGLTVLLEAIVEIGVMLRDRRSYERSWCTVMSESMKDHIILVGLGRMGYGIYLMLRRLNEKVVVIERDSQNQFLEDVRRDGMPLLIGDARREALLRDANACDAKSIVLATTDDLANLEVGLDAKKINPKIRVVLRMFDPNMANKIRDGFNIQMAMSQAFLAAPAFATAAIDEAIINSVVVDDKLVITLRWHVRERGVLYDRTVGEIMKTLSVGILERSTPDGKATLFPPPETRIGANEELLVQGEYDKLKQLLHVDEWDPELLAKKAAEIAAAD